MADSTQEGPGETGEDTDDLLYSDVEVGGSGSGAGSTPAQLARDHCDLLLDAIDAQLSRLQAQSNAGRTRGDDGNRTRGDDGNSGKRMDHSNAAVSQSQSVSRDTGLGSTIHTNDTPTTHLHVVRSETQELSSETRSGSRAPDSQEEEDDGKGGAVVGRPEAEEEEEEAERERCRWRLELLLGRAEAGFGRSPPRRDASVCTEDFAARFRDEMLEAGSRGSWEGLAPGPGGQPRRAEEGTREMECEIPALEKMAVSANGSGGGHFGSHRAPRHAWDSPESPGILSPRLGRGHTVEMGGTTADIGGRPPLDLREQSGQAPCSHHTPPGGDTERSGETDPDQVELSPRGCAKPGGYQESRLIAGRSVSMTALPDSTPLCVPTSPGTVPTRHGRHQTSTPCAEGSGGLTTASLKHRPDITARTVNASGVRTMSRCLSCPGPIPEATGQELEPRTPYPGWTPLPRSPLRDTDPALHPPRPAEGPRVEQRGGNRVHSPYVPPCSGSAPPHCTNGEVLHRTGFGSAPGPPSSVGTGALTVSRSSMNTGEAEGVPDPPVCPPVRHLAGVPVKSFDSVTIDSDLDSVQTDRVRKHFRNALRSGAAVRSARVLHPEDPCTDQSDPDLLLEPRPKFSLQALRRNVPGGGRHVRKPRPPRRETPSAVVRYDCSGDEETDEVEGEEEEEEEQAGLSGLFPRGLVQKNSAPWRKRPSRLKRPHLRTLTGGWMEAMSSDWLLLEEALHSLRQNCLREEDRLKQKRDQLHDTELSLTTLLQQKKHAVQELECTRVRAEQAEREGRSLEASLRDGRVQADSTRSQLRLLQAQRDAHMQELTDLEAELTALRRHKAVLQERTGAALEKRHAGRLSVLEREEMDRQLDSAKTELFAEQRRARHKLDSLQERLEETQQELDQRVEEVRILRESHCSLQEQLTEQREELEQRRREEVQEEAQGHQAQVQELQDQLEVQGGRVGALECLLSQKEQQEVEAQEQLGTLQEERRSLEEQLLSQREEHGARLKEAQEERRSLEEQLLSQREEYGSRLKEAQEERRSLEEEHSSTLKEIQERRRTLEEEHCTRLREAQEQAERDKELQLEQLRSELSLAAKQEIQQVLAQAEEEKQEALREQALSLTLHADALQARIQLKEEELRKMKEALERQEVSMRKQLEQLRAESEKHAAAEEERRRLQELLEEQQAGTQELVRRAVEQERRKWEAELRAQREALEDQARRAGERASEEAERERRNCLALQNKIVELQTRVQEQDGEVRLQQREQAAALAAQRRALRDEQQSELQSLRRHLEQEAQREAQREVRRLQQAVQEAQGEAQSLRATLAERGRGQEEGVARAEQLQRGWASELGAECRRLQELLEPGGATGGAVPLPHSPTVAQVVQTFRSTREQLCSLVSRLQQDLESQRHAAQQLSREKERELRTQRENLTVEREQALDSLKERLIQDHIEELSSLQRSQLRDSSGEAGGVAASLRRQLQDKDGELREVQRSMGRWKEQTAARLARKFEEELTAELERCKAQLLKERRVPRARTDQQRKLQRLEAEMRQLTMEYGDPGVLRSTSTPSLVSLDPPAGPGPPDLATFKLLRHLQSRVRQLRAENSVHLGSHLGSHLRTHLETQLGSHLGSPVTAELAGSYLETISPPSEHSPMRSRAHIRTVLN